MYKLSLPGWQAVVCDLAMIVLMVMMILIAQTMRIFSVAICQSSFARDGSQIHKDGQQRENILIGQNSTILGNLDTLVPLY